MYTATTGKPC